MVKCEMRSATFSGPFRGLNGSSRSDGNPPLQVEACPSGGRRHPRPP